MPFLHHRKMRPTGKCPGCGLNNPFDCDVCRHCGRDFSLEDELEMIRYASAQKQKGIRFAIGLALVYLLVFILYGFFS